MDINSNDDIFSKMEQVEISNGNKSSARTSKLKFDIDEKEDNELLVIIKNLVNERDLEYNDLYKKVGKSLGWNMIHGARKHQISWERFKIWMDFLDMNIDLSVQSKNKK